MPEQFFKVANWPATISDLRSDDPLSVQAWARQVKDWQEELLRILDHTLATEGAGVGEIIEEIPFPPTRVLFAGAAGQITTDAGFTYDAATDIASLTGGVKLGNLTATRVAYVGAAGLVSDDAGFTHQAAVNAGMLLYLNDLTTGGEYAEGLYVQLRYIGALRDLLNLQSGLAGTTLAERFVVQSDGIVQFSAQAQHPAGTAAAPSIARIGYLDDGIYWPADGAVGVAVGANGRLVVTDTVWASQVGIQSAAGGSGTYIRSLSDFVPNADSTLVCGHSSAYWSNLYADKMTLNSTAYLDGAVAAAIVAFLSGAERLRVSVSGGHCLLTLS